MTSSILALFSLAALLGTEPPKLGEPFKSDEACLIAAAKLNNELAESLIKTKSGFVCLKLVQPTI